MKRSGQHGIINWLAQQFDEEVHHFNGCHFHSEWEIIPTGADWVVEYRYGNKYDYKKSGWRRFVDMRESSTVQQIFSFEDYYVRNVISKLKFDNYHLVVVVRDAYNLLASTLKYVENRGGNDSDYYLKHRDERVKRLLEHYSQSKYHINYNKWVISKKYRDEVANYFNLKNTDRGLEEVGDFGKGSSFDRLKFDGKASEMNVFERYKDFLDDERYLEMINNEELKEQTQDLFGIQI